MRTRNLTIVIVIILAALLGACSKSSSEGRCESSFSQPGSFENQCRFGVRDQTSQSELKVEADLKSGSIDFILTDANGQVVWQKTASAEEQFSAKQLFDQPATGFWLLQINTHQAQGSYTALWNGQ